MMNKISSASQDKELFPLEGDIINNIIMDHPPPPSKLNYEHFDIFTIHFDMTDMCGNVHLLMISIVEAPTLINQNTSL